MPGYRIYEIGQDGHVVRLLAELTLDNDVRAIAYAEQRRKHLRFGKASGWSIVFAARPVPQM
jgi:hypothetical protein